MELIGKQNRHWQEFSSVSDILDFITLDKFIQKDNVMTSSGANPPGGINPSRESVHAEFRETIRMMEEGWPEGRDQIEEVVVDIEKRVMGYLPVPETYHDVEGLWLDETAFAEGDPECWVGWRDSETASEKRGNKIIHVVLNVDVTGRPFERGAAGVAIIDALERCGHRVIADAIANSTGRGGKLLETRIRVKESDEPVQLDKLAFLFAHRNVLRHVLFAAWERLPKPVRDMYGFSTSYGMIAGVPKEDQGDIYVERSAGYMGSIEEVAKYVLSTIAEQGIAVSEEIH